MKTLPGALLAFAALSISLAAGAAGYVCKPVTGTVQLFPDPECGIVQLPWIESRFPSVLFLGSMGLKDSCFRGVFKGSWGGIPLAGKSLSGLTAISNPPPEYSATFATAATVLQVAQDPDGPRPAARPLGTLYLLDSIRFIDPVAGEVEEQLVITAATGAFRNAAGSLGIKGNEFLPPGAPVSGTLCVPE